MELLVRYTQEPGRQTYRFFINFQLVGSLLKGDASASSSLKRRRRAHDPEAKAFNQHKP